MKLTPDDFYFVARDGSFQFQKSEEQKPSCYQSLSIQDFVEPCPGTME